MRIILLGPPGSGKGTQGDLIAKTYGFPRISTGDLLRKAVQDGTPLGRDAAAEMNRGGLVPDPIVLALVRERIFEPDCRDGYILDGFPRTIVQAEAIEALDPARPEIVIAIDVPEEELVRRMEGRRACVQCGMVYNIEVRKPVREGVCDVCGSALIQRPDDRPEVIRERLKVYTEKTEPLIAHYAGKKTLRRVDGSIDIETTFGTVRAILDAVVKGGRGAGVRT
jgi:adenylate kinase